MATVTKETHPELFGSDASVQKKLKAVLNQQLNQHEVRTGIRAGKKVWMKLEADLPPCPFCGQESPHLSIQGEMFEVMLYFVKCLGCLAAGPIAGNDTPEKAAEGWSEWRKNFVKLVGVTVEATHSQKGEQTPDFIRVSGECICEVCGKPYWKHPLDKEALSYDGKPFLHIHCDGTRLKL